MSNSLGVTLEGRTPAARDSQKLHRSTLDGLIARSEKQFRSLIGRTSPHKIHQKRRRLENLRHRLWKLNRKVDAGVVRLCFGSRKLWRARLNLEANGYADHADWLTD